MIEHKLNKGQQKVTDDALVWPSRAHALQVVSPDTYEEAATLLKAIKALGREADKVFDPPIKKQNEAIRAMRDAKSKVKDPLDQAEKITKGNMGAWAHEEEQKRIAAQRAAEEEARAQAEADRDAEAEAAAAAGDQELAEAIVEQPVVPPSVAVTTTVPKVAGVSMRTLHRARVIDPVTFLAFIYENCAERPELIKYVEFNASALRKWAETNQGAGVMPGVEYYTKQSMAAG
jgi:hypothetical protein